MAALPVQAFALTLSSSVIEDMIQSVQNGEGVKLSLGNNPVSCCVLNSPPPRRGDLTIGHPTPQ